MTQEQLREILNKMSLTHAKNVDMKLLESIIGSTILNFKVEKIKDRKRMWLVTIITDAPDVTITDVFGSVKTKYKISNLTLRVVM